MQEVFIQLGLTLGIALIISIIMKLLRQPLLIGYIITGIIVGPAVANIVHFSGPLEAFSHIGIALLLFIVGLGLNPKVIKDVGRVAIFTGLAQIIVTTAIGYIISTMVLHFTPLVSLYLSFAFSLSSTIIVLKLLSQKEEQDTLYGRISIGFLLIQDIVTMLFFLILSSISNLNGGNLLVVISTTVLKLLAVILILAVIMKYIIPRIDKYFADNKELLFLFSISCCFVIGSIFYKLGFSLELGALAAGVILSVSPYQREIAMRLHSLRDFFIIIFFIIIGTNIYNADLNHYSLMIVIFSLFILIGNPLILILVMKSLKYTAQTSFYAGLTVAQISEFSLILIGMGISMGHLPAELLGPATIVGVITIAISTYYITNNNKIYGFFKKPLHKIFHEKGFKNENNAKSECYDVILFGCHRLGGGLIKTMKDDKVNFVVVDHDPLVIKILTTKKIPCVYGSADDANLLESLNIQKCKMIISTIPENDVNKNLISLAKKINPKCNIICIANRFSHAESLYNAGANYVIMPPYLGRRFIIDLFKKNKFNNQLYKKEKARHLFDLQYLDKNQHF